MISRDFNECELLDGIRQRDNSCFEYLMNKSYPQISSLVIRNQGSRDDVNDLLQDCMVIVFENIVQGKFHANSGVLTYFYSICKNRWMNYLTRKKNRHIPIQNYSQCIELLEEESETNETEEKLNFITALVSSATDRCKEILTAYYYEDKSMAEIAIKLGYTNADNAKNQKAKCMEKLRNAVRGTKILNQSNAIE